MAMNGPPLAAGPMVPAVSTEPPGAGVIPFTIAASPPRTVNSVQTTTTLAVGQQSIVNVLPGTGYLIWLDHDVQLVTAGNAATVAVAEDAPWSAMASYTLDDGGPQVINIDGYALYLVNRYSGTWQHRPDDLSADASVFSAITTGAGATGGSGRFRQRLPVAINERNYIGLMGNQDRATRYNVRSDLAASTAIYTTAPTTLPTVNIRRTYGYLPVPGPISADGRRQEQMPAWYGVLHYLTSVRSDALPAGSSRVNHYIRNLANAVRVFILVFRSGAGATPRAVAETTMPSQIDFKLGTDTIWSESTNQRRRIMWDRYGWDAPAGVLVYDLLADFGMHSGKEMGDHYLYLGNISEAQFEITYPAGWAAGSYLQVITDSLFIPPGVIAQGI